MSQTLQNAGLSRQQRLEVINSFTPGSIVARTSQGEEVVRFFGGDASKLGRFVTNTFPQGNVRSVLALPSNNSATSLSTFQLSSGTRVFQGTVAPNFGKPGGGIQIFVPNLRDLKP